MSSSSTSTRVVAVVLGLSLTVVPVASAQEAEQTAPETDQAAAETAAETARKDAQTREWTRRLAEIQKQLKAQEYEAARDAARELGDEMADDIGGGEDAAYTLAVASAYRALAETGLGNRETGLWYWRAATSLYPEFADADLSVFGEPAGWLQSVPFRSRVDTREVTPGGEVEPPRAERTVEVDYPRALVDEGLEATVIVELVIDQEGRPSEPRIVSGTEVPSLAYAALDAIRQWEFEPATYNDAPVAVVDRINIDLESTSTSTSKTKREPRATYPER